MDSQVNKHTLNKWVELELLNCPSWIKERVGIEEIRRRVSKSVQQNLSFCFDDEFAKRNYGYCKIKGTSAEDYKYRFLSTPFGEIVTSIRFIGGDLNKPAVYLVYKDFELVDAKNIRLICQLLKKEYTIFNPERIFWNSSNIESKLIDTEDFVTGDMVTISYFLDHLQSLEKPDNFDQIELKHARSLEWYAIYQNAYEALQKKWPAFVEMGQLSSESTLQELMNKKLLFEIFVEGEWAGVIGSNEDNEGLLIGYYIEEEFLLEQFRGKKMAASVQRHLIERLSPENDSMLSGTIHYDNLPSLKTAKRVGRKPIGMDVFAAI